jgi:hypothetical protein
MDVAAETCPDRDVVVADFAARLTARDLAPHRGIHLWEHTRPGFLALTAWAYTLPAHHPVCDPHPVLPDDTSTSLHEWAYAAQRTVAVADLQRRTADLIAPAVVWEFRAHPATLTALMGRDWAAERAYVEALARREPGALRSGPPRPVLDLPHMHDPDGGWTVHGHPLAFTTHVEQGLLHAHQVLPVAGAA